MNESACRKVIRERSAGFCEVRLDGKNAYVCQGVAQSAHHRKKRSQGGLWVPSNLLDICGDGTRGCHGYIEANPVMARRRGLWLYGGQAPTDTPAFLCFRGQSSWYLLDDEGGIKWLNEDQVRRLVPSV